MSDPSEVAADSPGVTVTIFFRIGYVQIVARWLHLEHVGRRPSH